MQITRLRITGFKSFVDPTDLGIEPGQSGIVGPNGCGKSNLVEALRWVMGENSPKSMRGSGMDDVIFAGSGNRPARNMAEVTVTLDNSGRTAPPAFNDADVLEVSRRIEREAGSVYRVNGREVRARDVQILFADASTGAHSPALVGQGRIGELISAKPRNRRQLLEEAAGISGLHSRRHEAELRLQAAETNLTRVADVIQQLEGQLSALRRQARQATRYRNLSGDIRRTEARLLLGRWTAAQEAIARAEAELAEAEAKVTFETERTAAASVHEIEASQGLPALRDDEAKAAAAYHRLVVERDRLDAEDARLRADLERLTRSIGEAEADLSRERERLADADSALERLQSERTGLEEAGTGAADKLAEAEALVRGARETLQACEQALDKATRDAANVAAQRASLKRTIEDNQSRLARHAAERDSLAQEQAALEQAARETAAIETARASLEQARSVVAQAQLDVADAETRRSQSERDELALREPLQTADRRVSRLKAEAEAITKLLGGGTGDLWPPVVDAITVEPGYEAALGAALGDDLDLPANEAAPAHWSDLGALEGTHALPGGAEPLSSFVTAPAALQRRLALIGVVDGEHGKALQAQLLPGQRLVSRAGDLWRWDGLTAHAEAPTAAAQRLAQRNRLKELYGEIVSAEGEAVVLRNQSHDLRRAVEDAANAERAARQTLRSAEAGAGSARERLAEAETAAARMDARRQALADSDARLAREIEAAEARVQSANEALAGLAADETLAQAVQAARDAAAEARLAVSEHQSAFDLLRRELNLREARAKEIARDITSWTDRRAHAARQIETLDQRLQEARAQHEAAAARPAEIAALHDGLGAALAEAEAKRRQAADALAAGETGLRNAAREARTAEHDLGEAREARARLDAMKASAHERADELRGRIREALECEPEGVLERAELAEGDELPAVEEMEKRLERLKRERETLGGVNLRADEEATEVEAQLNGLSTERTDLEAAIAKLRQGIGKLNAEGRERLLASFDIVNGHFQRLFTHLFGGGTAELKLVESDDPLEAGLEIFARPPGKKLQVMTLLSGGEQTLTALSLIFAVFLSNPAPICVLDEVDAPLDDANVERFCNLVDEMTRITQTRFMIITHHPLTMARMDRLFGVTMAERGVSQLVSVDLAAAEKVLVA